MRPVPCALAAALALVPAVAPHAQPQPRQAPAPAAPAPEADLPGFLFLNQERILTGSRAGQALLAEEEAARETLRTEARAIDSTFEAEERRLTEQRPTLPPEEFRALADAFDARVVEARRQQDERSAQLAQEFDQRRRAFYAQVAPILVMLMDRHGARAILDEGSVLLADQSINITEEVIAEIDAGGAAPEPDSAGPAGEDEEGQP